MLQALLVGQRQSLAGGQPVERGLRAPGSTSVLDPELGQRLSDERVVIRHGQSRPSTVRVTAADGTGPGYGRASGESPPERVEALQLLGMTLAHLNDAEARGEVSPRVPLLMAIRDKLAVALREES